MPAVAIYRYASDAVLVVHNLNARLASIHPGDALRLSRVSQLEGVQGVRDCRSRDAVRIEPSLRPLSPKNGNISACGQRLLAISPRLWQNREAGDRSRN